MGANDPRGRSQFGTQGHNWQDICRVPLNFATYILNIQALCLVISENKIFSCFPIISL